MVCLVAQALWKKQKQQKHIFSAGQGLLQSIEILKMISGSEILP